MKKAQPPRKNSLIVLISLALILVSFYSYANSFPEQAPFALTVGVSLMLLELFLLGRALRHEMSEFKDSVDSRVLGLAGQITRLHPADREIHMSDRVGDKPQKPATDTPTISQNDVLLYLMNAGGRWSSPQFSMNQIGGLDGETKKQLQEIISMLKAPQRFQQLGTRLPSGILLVGPSGVGKTMLAHAIASEVGYAELFLVNTSSVLGPLVGIGVERMKKIFQEARKHAPCVILFDELEGVADSRKGDILGGAESERQAALNLMLMEMEANREENILIIAETNRADLLDASLFRSGHFEKVLYLDLPDPSGRKEILRMSGIGKKLDASLSLPDIAHMLAFNSSAMYGTSGFSGADLVAIWNEAAMDAGFHQQESIELKNLEIAIKRVRHMVFQQSSNQNASPMRRSLAQFYAMTDRPMTFHDVGGLGAVKGELTQYIDFLRGPQLYFRQGCRIPRGVLLSGLPGVGKTLLARAVAGEAGVPFFFVSGSQFNDLYTGTGAARIQDLFRIARRQSPCVIFIDEIDAIGISRDFIKGPDHTNTLTQFLTELDGFTQEEGVMVLAATNQANMLDVALLRSGRVEHHIAIPLPSKEERRAILNIYLRKDDHLDTTHLEVIIVKTDQKTGADLENLINTARIHAVHERSEGRLTWPDIEYAFATLP